MTKGKLSDGPGENHVGSIPTLIQLRVDPAHARAAGYRVVFGPTSSCCDICACDQITHRVSRRPQAMALIAEQKTLIYYPAEWAFCDECYAVRHDEDALFDRLPGVAGVPPDYRDLIAAQQVHAVFAWRHSGQPYRSRKDALLHLRESMVAAVTVANDPRPGLKVVDLTGMP